MRVLDGTLVATARRANLKHEIANWSQTHQRSPGLAVLLVGDDPASQVYVRNKVKACAQVGIHSFRHDLPTSTTQAELTRVLMQLRQDPSVDGILVQLPLPKHLSAAQVLGEIDPLKDADGLTFENVGLFAAGTPRVIPCTPKGILSILDHYQISVAGKRAVVIGRSQIVGRPMAQALLARDATVTICHSQTKDILAYTKEADLVVVAAGQARQWGRDAFKKGAVVIDVGVHRKALKPDGVEVLCGDVRTEELDGWVDAVTPVPGGVGPMTITSLLENTFHLAKLRS